MPVPEGSITESSIWTAESAPKDAVDVNLATRCECGGPLDYTGDYDPAVLYTRLHTADCKNADLTAEMVTDIKQALTEEPVDEYKISD